MAFMDREGFHWYLLGPGLFGSWGFLLFFWMQGNSTDVMRSDTLYLASMLVTGCIVMVIANESLALSTARAMARMGCLAMVVGFAADALLSSIGVSSGEAQMLLKVVLGAGVNVFWIAWAYLLSHLEVEKTELTFLWWAPLSAVVFAVVALTYAVFGLAGHFYAPMLLVIPVLSLLAFERALSDVEVEREIAPGDADLEEADALPARLANPYLSLVLAHIAVSLVWFSLLSMGSVGFLDSAILFAAGSLLVFVVVWLALRTTRHFRLSTLYLWVLPMLVCGVVCATFGSATALTLAFLFLSTVNIGFEIMIKLFSVHMAIRRPNVAWKMVSLGSIIPCIGGLLSPMMLDLAVKSVGESSLSQVMLLSMAGFVVVACIALGRLDISPGVGSLLNADVREPEASDESQEDGSAQDEQAGESSLAGKCRLIAEQYGLSARELDVLMLLMQGRSRTFIREALYISKGTVDSHIHHIYVKSGVRSKNELMSLVLDDDAE